LGSLQIKSGSIYCLENRKLKVALTAELTGVKNFRKIINKISQ